MVAFGGRLACWRADVRAVVGGVLSPARLGNLTNIGVDAALWRKCPRYMLLIQGPRRATAGGARRQ